MYVTLDKYFHNGLCLECENFPNPFILDFTLIKVK
jgi:hypothetical protein